MHHRIDQPFPPQGRSNLSRAFAQRQNTMNPEHNLPEVRIEAEGHLRRIDNYIDSNYNDIDRYVDDDVFVDHVSMQRRTTSIHRNVAASTPGRGSEERRQWTAAAATLSRQPLDQHVRKIVSYMREDKALKEDSPEGEQLRREALKNMPQSLAVKKRVKREFVSSISNTKTLGLFRTFKYQIAMSWSHLKANFKEFIYTFELWYSSLKKIEGNFGSGVASYFKFLRWLFVINLTVTILSFCFICIPQIIHTTNENVTTNSSDIRPLDFLNGRGFLNDSLLFYGHYSNETISGYSIPDAYLYTMSVLYIVVFIVLSVSMARSYRKTFIETKGGLQNVFAHKIFCGWDYGIATKKAASLKSKSIYNELRELIGDATRVKKSLSFCDKFRITSMQIIAHVFAVVVALSSGYLMHILLEKNDDPYIVLPVVINVVMTVVPMVFRVIASYEEYKNPKSTLFVTLARTIFLELCVIAVLIYFWLNKASKKHECWENGLAQEIYRLVLFDFFFSTIFMTLIDIAWYLMHKASDSIDAPEFDIATNTLSIIYNQTLFWLGFYFSPLLGAIVVLKLFLTWYIRSIILMNCCQAPKKSWRAAQTESWFLIITFLWTLVLLFVHGYHIFEIDSSGCGPNFSFSSNDSDTSVILFLLKPGVIAIALFALALIVYYLRAVANSQIDMVNFLRHRLVLIAKDKEFLIQNINNVTKGEYKHKKFANNEHLTDPMKLAPNVPRSANPNSTSSDEFLSHGPIQNIPEHQFEGHPRRRY